MEDVVYYLHGDHLGSTVLTTDGEGQRVGEVRYRPYGTERYRWRSIPTARRFTGQRWEGGVGLYDYNARWYDPALGRFVQPDTIVPDPGNPQDLNRYSYVRNNPVRYIDPTGHYLLLGGEPGTWTEFAVRRHGDTVVILYGGTVFLNPVEVAIANYVLTGDPRYLARLPEMSGLAGPAGRGTLVNVNTGLGYEYRSWRGQVWGEIGPTLLGAGLSFKPGSQNREDWLAHVPARYRASVAQAFEGTPEVITLSEDLIVYRHWGGDAHETGSPWFSPKPYVRPGNARRYLALPDYNSATRISVFKIPAGTTIIRGKVASQLIVRSFLARKVKLR